MTVAMLGGVKMSAWGWLPARSVWLHLVPIALLWPVGYIVFTARKDRTCDTVS